MHPLWPNTSEASGFKLMGAPSPLWLLTNYVPIISLSVVDIRLASTEVRELWYNQHMECPISLYASIHFVAAISERNTKVLNKEKYVCLQTYTYQLLIARNRPANVLSIVHVLRDDMRTFSTEAVLYHIDQLYDETSYNGMGI